MRTRPPRADRVSRIAGRSSALSRSLSPKAKSRAGTLECDGRRHRFPIEGFIPRFVSSDDYADAFRLSGTSSAPPISTAIQGSTARREFRSFLDFPVERLEGKLVLDAGCGLGRFSEIVLNYGGHVVAVDMSRAIDAARREPGARRTSTSSRPTSSASRSAPKRSTWPTAQGVLHHTPDPPAAFACLPPLVKPGGA